MSHQHHRTYTLCHPSPPCLPCHTNTTLHTHCAIPHHHAYHVTPTPPYIHTVPSLTTMSHQHNPTFTLCHPSPPCLPCHTNTTLHTHCAIPHHHAYHVTPTPPYIHTVPFLTTMPTMSHQHHPTFTLCHPSPPCLPCHTNTTLHSHCAIPHHHAYHVTPTPPYIHSTDSALVLLALGEAVPKSLLRGPTQIHQIIVL